MMVLPGCLRCGAPYRDPIGDPIEGASTSPWPTRFAFLSIHCKSCGTPTHMCHNDAAQHKTSAWNGWSEQMVAGEDYEVVHRRPGASRLDGSRPTVVAWAYHPLEGQVDMDVMICKAFASMSQLSKEPGKETVGILVMASHQDPEIYAPMYEHCDEVWRLDERVTSDVVGPYPSVRATRSIAKTLWSPHYRVGIGHVWPVVHFEKDATVLFSRVDCMNDQDMMEAWSAHSRTRIRIHAKKKGK